MFYSIDQPKADIIKNVLYSDRLFFLQKFLYTHPLEDFHIVYSHIDASFFPFFRKISTSFTII